MDRTSFFVFLLSIVMIGNLLKAGVFALVVALVPLALLYVAIELLVQFRPEIVHGLMAKLPWGGSKG